jgi:uncharacterized protein YegP (UPF0339 family)
MTFEIFKSKDNLYRFRIRAGNQKIVAQSEGYKRWWNAKRAVIALVNGIRSSHLKLRAEA